jgi:hypothetical protein
MRKGDEFFLHGRAPGMFRKNQRWTATPPEGGREFRMRRLWMEGIYQSGSREY